MNGLLQNIDSDKNLTKIKFTINDMIPGAVIILFGSRAKGKDHPNSDYDLLIIVDHSIDLKRTFRRDRSISIRS